VGYLVFLSGFKPVWRILVRDLGASHHGVSRPSVELSGRIGKETCPTVPVAIETTDTLNVHGVGTIHMLRTLARRAHQSPGSQR